AVPALPGPPISFGTDRSAFTVPSLAWEWPLRPPVAVAVAVNSGLILSMMSLLRGDTWWIENAVVLLLMIVGHRAEVRRQLSCGTSRCRSALHLCYDNAALS